MPVCESAPTAPNVQLAALNLDTALAYSHDITWNAALVWNGKDDANETALTRLIAEALKKKEAIDAFLEVAIGK